MTRKPGVLMSICATLVGVSALLFAISTASAQIDESQSITDSIVVDTQEDELNNDGDCSLREAIISANTDTAVDGCLAGGGTDIIVLPTGIYLLTVSSGGTDEDSAINGDLDITDSLTISGGDSTISDMVDSRIFEVVTPSIQVTLNNLTMRDGHGQSEDDPDWELAGGILNRGDLTINNSTISDNYAGHLGDGGGIFSTGSLTITHSLITRNSAAEGYWGGINSSGTTRIIHSQIIDNHAEDIGGISIGGVDSSIVDSTISGNWAFRCGAGVSTDTTLLIQNSIISGNEGGFGCNTQSGIVNRGILSIENSVISGNGSGNGYFIGKGGGIYNFQTLTITNSVIENNRVEEGGGIYHSGGSLTIINTTLSGNKAYQHGGGIFISDGIAFLQNVTISGNSADSGGGIALTGGELTTRNSIIAGNMDLSSDLIIIPDCSSVPGGIISVGHNLVGKVDGCNWGNAPGDLTGTIALPVDPLLGPLQDNGGDTQTHALLSGSPAIDAADPKYYPPTDQRGVPRPLDGNGDGNATSDIGAFEIDTPISGLLATNDSPTILGNPTTLTATVCSGTNVSYLWDFGDETTGIGNAVTHTYPALGAYTATVTASNSAGSLQASTGVITVNIQAPVADAGPDQSIETLSLVTLDGSASSDPDGDTPLTYMWTQTDGPTVTLDDQAAVNPTFTAPSDPTTLTFSLIVTDSLDLDSEPDYVVISVNNQKPIADAGSHQLVTIYSLVILDGSGSNDSDGDTPLTYQWTQTGGPTVTLDDPTAVNPTFTAPSDPTVLTFSLVVTDSLGLASDPDEVVITTYGYHVFLPLILR